MTYQARAAPQVRPCAPSCQSQIQLAGDRERRGIRTALCSSWFFRRGTRVLKPHARAQLFHLHTCGFSLQPQPLYSQTVWTGPVAPPHTRAAPRGKLSHHKDAHHPPPPSECVGKLPLQRVDSNGGKENSFPVWQASSSLQH